MAFVIAFLLAIFVLPAPWGIVAIVAGGVIEAGEAWFWWRLSHRRRPVTGAEALVGATAHVTAACAPIGQVRVVGELWQARCPEGAGEGEVVKIIGIEGLTLVVKPA